LNNREIEVQEFEVREIKIREIDIREIEIWKIEVREIEFGILTVYHSELVYYFERPELKVSYYMASTKSASKPKGSKAICMS